MLCKKEEVGLEAVTTVMKAMDMVVSECLEEDQVHQSFNN